MQSLELVFAEDSVLPDGRRLPWPSVFEDRLRSLTNDTGKQGITTQGRSLARSTASSIQFEGKGEDLDDVCASADAAVEGDLGLAADGRDHRGEEPER